MYTVKIYLKSGNILTLKCDNPKEVLFKSDGSLDNSGKAIFYDEIPININPNYIEAITYELKY